MTCWPNTVRLRVVEPPEQAHVMTHAAQVGAHWAKDAFSSFVVSPLQV